MDLRDQAESGPDTGNAGTADDRNEFSLDDAISKAIGGESDASQSPAPAKAQETTGKNDQLTEYAGAKDAPAAEAKPEAAQEGNADREEAPQHWPAERRRAFAELPRGAQEIVKGFVKDLNAGFTRKSQELSDKARFADGVRSLFSDVDRAEMQRYGADELQSFAVLVRLNQFAQQNPVEYVKWAMHHFKVTPDQLFPQQQGNPQQDAKPAQEPGLDDLFQDPRVNALQSELASIKQQIEAEQARQRDAVQQQQVGHVNTLKSAIGTFRSAIDDSGQLRYPHFDQVSRAMGALMETHPRLSGMPDSFEKLDFAYRMAVMADPELSSPIIESQVAARLAEEQRRQEAERAKRVGGVRAPLGAPTTRPKTASLDDAIGAAITQAGF